MTVESVLYDLLSPLVDGEFYPDVAQDPQLPYGTYQQVGGQSIGFLDLTVPSKRNARFQIVYWSATRLQASDLIRQAHDLLIADASLQATALGEAVSVYEEDTRRYGARQDFSVWFDA